MTVPSMLFGREEELKVLAEVHNLSRLQGPTFAFVEGVAGIGKTSLVESFLRQVRANAGIFAVVKCDRQDRRPMLAIHEIAVGLVHRVFEQDLATVAALRHNLSEFNRQSLAFLASRIPALNSLVERTQSYRQKEVFDEHKAFVTACSDLLERVTRTENPLVIVIDDFQWIDADSARSLLDIYERSFLANCMVIIVNRPFSPNDNPDAYNFLIKVKRSAMYREVALKPLGEKAVASWCSVTFPTLPNSEMLVTQLLQKTRGIPYDLHQLFSTVEKENKLKALQQCIDSDPVMLASSLPVNDSVAHLLEETFSEVNHEAKALLILICITGPVPSLFFDRVLVGNDTPNKVLLDQLQKDMWLILKEGRYHFSHDRLQDSLLPRVNLRWVCEIVESAINDLTIDRESSLGVGAYDFELYNLIHFLGCHEERKLTNFSLLTEILSHLILKERLQSYRFVVDAISFLLNQRPGKLHQSDYAACIPLVLAGQKAALEGGEFEIHDTFYEFLRTCPLSDIDLLSSETIHIQSLVTQCKPREAIEFGKRLFDRFSIPHRERFGALSYLKRLHYVTGKFNKLTPEIMIPSANRTEGIHEKFIQICNILAPPAYFIDRPFLRNLALTGVSLMVENEAYEQAPFMTMALGYIYLEMKWYEKAITIVTTGMNMAENAIYSEYVRNRTFLAGYNLVTHIRSPLNQNIDRLRSYFDRCFQNGDHEYAGLSLVYSTYLGYYSGQSLTTLSVQADSDSISMKRLQVSSLQDQQHVYHQFIHNLVHATPGQLATYRGPAYDEQSETAIANRRADNRSHFDLLLCKAMSACFSGDFIYARKNALEAHNYLDSAANTVSVYVYNFYRAYIAANLLLGSCLKNKDSRRYKVEFRRYTKAVKKSLKHYEIFNRSKYLILQGFSACLAADPSKAIAAFSDGIDDARASGRIYEVVIAQQARIDITLRMRLRNDVALLVHEHIQTVEDWGARALLRSIRNRYAEILDCSPKEHTVKSEWELSSLLNGIRKTESLQAGLALLSDWLMVNAKPRRILTFAANAMTARWSLIRLQDPYNDVLMNQALNELSVRINGKVLNRAIHSVDLSCARVDEAQSALFDSYHSATEIIYCIPVSVEGLARAVVYLEFSGISYEGHERLTSQFKRIKKGASREFHHLFKHDALLSNIKKYRSLCDHAATGILQFKRSGEVTVANLQLRNWLRMPEPIGMTDGSENVYTADWANRLGIDTLVTRLNMAVVGETASTEVQLFNPSADVTLTLHVIAKVNLEDTVDVFVTDISSHKAHQVERRKRENAELRAARSHQQFAMLSQELFHPLRQVLVPAQALLASQNPEPEDVHRYSGAIVENAQRLLKSAKDLMWFMQYDEHEAQFDPSAVDLCELIREFCYLARPYFTQAQRGLSVYLPEESAIALVDGHLFKRLLLNVLENSIKYTHSGGQIQIAFKADKNQLKLKISDDGIGIPKDELDSVFQRFHRAENARLHADSGLGLGLALVNDICSLHGFDLEIESEEGEGTHLTVLIPAISDLQIENLTAQDQDKSASMDPEGVPEFDMHMDELSILGSQQTLSIVPTPSREGRLISIVALGFPTEVQTPMKQLAAKDVTILFLSSIDELAAALESNDAHVVVANVTAANGRSEIHSILAHHQEAHRPDLVIVSDQPAHAGEVAVADLFDAKGLQGLCQRITLSGRLIHAERTNQSLSLRYQRASRQLHDTKLELSNLQKRATLSSLITCILHELNNPISQTLAALNFAIRMNSSPIVADSVKDALEAQQRIVDLITDLRGLILPERRIQKRDQLILPIIQLAIRYLRDALATIKVEIDVQTDMTFCVNRSFIVQLFFNILSNAARAVSQVYPEKGGVIRISVEQNEEGLSLIVADNGPGFSSDITGKVARPFNTQHSKDGGTGLGMSLIRFYVEAHHGRMGVRTTNGGGATIWMQFPFEQSETDAAPLFIDSATDMTNASKNREKDSFVNNVNRN